MDFSLKTVSLREIKTPRNVRDALKPKSEKRTKTDRIHKLFHRKHGWGEPVVGVRNIQKKIDKQSIRSAKRRGLLK